MRQRSAVTTYEGAVYTHRVLMRTARVFLDAAQASPKGSFYNGLSASLFAWLAFEAYLNCVIEHLDPKVFADERRFFGGRKKKYGGVLGKLRWVLDTLGVEPTRTAERRRRIIVALHRLRNQLAHARPVRYSGTIRHAADEERPFMESQWVENRVQVAQVRRYVMAVTEFCEWLHEQIHPRFADPHLRRFAFEGTTQAQTSGTTIERIGAR